MVRARQVSVAAAVGAGSVGTVAGATYGLLVEQSRRARTAIGRTTEQPPRADGLYPPDGGPVGAAGTAALELVALGDSTAAGLGCSDPEELPGVLLARGLAEETDRPVRLTTHAVVGATTRVLGAQVEAALAGDHPPDAAVIIIGANDVTAKLSVAGSAERLAAAVRRLRGAGTVVVVGTCPDLGAIRPIPQPLRSLVRTWSLQLARAQRAAVAESGGHAVAVADLLSPEFLTRPDALFSADRFHPSAAGYEAAAALLLPALCAELGVWGGGPLPVAPLRSATAEARRPTVRLTSALNRTLQQRAREGGSAATGLLQAAERRARRRTGR